MSKLTFTPLIINFAMKPLGVLYIKISKLFEWLKGKILDSLRDPVHIPHLL